MPTTSQVIARRIGRLVFGVVLLIGAGSLVAAAFMIGLRHRSMHTGLPLDAAAIIGLSWLTAAVSGVAAWRIALRLELAGNPDRLFASSLMVPAAGIALVLPLSLHLPVVLAIGDRAAFDAWVWLSIWVTGLPHAVFAFMSARRGHQLVAGKPAWSPLKIYKVTIITSCLPYVVLYAIPPALVALTALPLLPMLRAMERIVTRERDELAGAPHLLPRAIGRMRTA
jgi:hypothetical protein